MRKRIIKVQRHAVLAVTCSGTKVEKNQSSMNVVSAAVYALVDLGTRLFIGTKEECEMLKAEMLERNISLSIIRA